VGNVFKVSSECEPMSLMSCGDVRGNRKLSRGTLTAGSTPVRRLFLKGNRNE